MQSISFSSTVNYKLTQSLLCYSYCDGMYVKAAFVSMWLQVKLHEAATEVRLRPITLLLRSGLDQIEPSPVSMSLRTWYRLHCCLMY